MPAFRHAENLAAFEEVAKNNHDKTKTLLEEKEALRQETEVYRRAKLLADGEREKAELHEWTRMTFKISRWTSYKVPIKLSLL